MLKSSDKIQKIPNQSYKIKGKIKICVTGGHRVQNPQSSNVYRRCFMSDLELSEWCCSSHCRRHSEPHRCTRRHPQTGLRAAAGTTPSPQTLFYSCSHRLSFGRFWTSAYWGNVHRWPRTRNGVPHAASRRWWEGASGRTEEVLQREKKYQVMIVNHKVTLDETGMGLDAAMDRRWLWRWCSWLEEKNDKMVGNRKQNLKEEEIWKW